MRKILLLPALCTVALLCPIAASAQTALDPLATPQTNNSSLLTQPTLSPGVLFLFDLEKKFAKATLDGGGKAFATWFADDAVTIENKQAPTIGRAAIAAGAQWDPKQYQLKWTPQGGQMLPAGDAGYTWGHYEGTAIDAHGNNVTTTGRYITMWKKQTDGTWKVALDASNEEPPASCECTVNALPGASATKPKQEPQLAISANSIFQDLLPKLMAASKIPVLLPSYIPFSKDKAHPIYAILMAADGEGYEIELTWDPSCVGGNACHLGTVRASLHSFSDDDSSKSSVPLSTGILGTFRDFTCGAHCDDSEIVWSEGNYHYSVSLKAGDKATLLKMADSMVTTVTSHR